MELIGEFLGKVPEYGIPDQEKFQTVDLYEGKNLRAVLICFQSMARKVCTIGSISCLSRFIPMFMCKDKVQRKLHNIAITMFLYTGLKISEVKVINCFNLPGKE